MKLLNDGGCKSETQGAAVVMAEALFRKKEVTLMKTRLLKKGQSSGSDTMLEIQNDYIVFHK